MTLEGLRVVRAELRYAIRAYVAHRLVAVAVILVTAVAIAGVTAIGGVIKRILLDPLPFPEPARLMRIASMHAKTGRLMPTPYAVYEEWRQRSRSFADLAAFSQGRPTLQLRDGAEPFDVAFMGESLPRVLGVTPLLGRAFEPREFQPGGGDVLLLTHDAWRRMYQEDPAALGRQISLDDRSYTIIGVLPPTTFEYPQSPFGMDAWLPLVRSATAIAKPTANTGDAVTVVGRLMPGTTTEQAQTDARNVAAAIARDNPAHRDRVVDVIPLSEVTAAGPRPALLLVVGALALVLAVACVNIANLLLARTDARRRDFAIMAAVGVTRASIARQLVFENLLLSISGAVLGLWLSAPVLRAFVALYPDPLPRPVGSDVILEIAPIAIAIAILTSVLAALPLLATIRDASIADLATDDRTRTASPASLRLRGGLMVVQLALSLVLLSTAASLTRAFVALSTVDPGYDDSIMAFAMGQVQRDRAPERARRFYTELSDTLAQQPGVVGVAMTSNLPTRGGMAASDIRFHGASGATVASDRPEAPPPMAHVVTASFARVMGMRVLRGRDLNDIDDAGSVPAALVNERLARVVYGSIDGVTGRTFEWDGRTWQIVGVVNSVRQRGPSEDVDQAFYVSWKQHARLPIFVLVRSTLDSQALATTIRTALSITDRARHAPIHTMATLADRAADLTRRERFRALTTSAISLLALTLVVMGIYGNIAFAVSQRRHEIAIRLALGDSGRRIQRRVIGHALVLSAGGVALGLFGAVAAGRWLESLIAGVVVRDVSMGIVTALLLVLIAVLAAWGPARAASRVDPAMLLKGN